MGDTGRRMTLALYDMRLLATEQIQWAERGYKAQLFDPLTGKYQLVQL